MQDKSPGKQSLRMSNQRFEKIKRTLNRRQPDLTVLMENVHKPHNLAALARTCDAIGIPEIHAVSSIRDLRISQMAAGGVRRWISVKKHQSTEDAFHLLKKQGLKIVVAHLDENTKDYKDIDYTVPTAIIAGSELDGISDYAVQHADDTVGIPMQGMVQSLNVSVAMSVILYQAMEQRIKAGMYDNCRLDKVTYETLLFEWMHPKVAHYCNRHKIDYPALNEDGDIIGKLNNLDALKSKSA